MKSKAKKTKKKSKSRRKSLDSKIRARSKEAKSVSKPLKKSSSSAVRFQKSTDQPSRLPGSNSVSRSIKGYLETKKKEIKTKPPTRGDNSKLQSSLLNSWRDSQTSFSHPYQDKKSRRGRKSNRSSLTGHTHSRSALASKDKLQRAQDLKKAKDYY